MTQLRNWASMVLHGSGRLPINVFMLCIHWYLVIWEKGWVGFRVKSLLVAFDLLAKIIHHFVKPLLQLSFKRILGPLLVAQGFPLPLTAVVMNLRADTKVCSGFVKLFIRTKATYVVLADVLVREIACRPA